jgi:hypothetical protein
LEPVEGRRHTHNIYALVLLAPKDFIKIYGFPIFFTISVLDECYSSNASYTLNMQVLIASTRWMGNSLSGFLGTCGGQKTHPQHW